MRIAGSIPLAAVVVAIALGVSGCSDNSTDSAATISATSTAAQSSTAQSSTAQSSTAQSSSAQPSAAPTNDPVPVHCGPGVHGLAVIAITTKGSGACANAVEVTNKYYDRQPAPEGVQTVTVSGVAWTCQQRQGQVNPYQECVSNADPAEKIRLSS